MRRKISMLIVAALMATMLVVSAVPALAVESVRPCFGGGAGDEFDPSGPVSFDCGGDDVDFETDESTRDIVRDCPDFSRLQGLPSCDDTVRIEVDDVTVE